MVKYIKHRKKLNKYKTKKRKQYKTKKRKQYKKKKRNKYKTKKRKQYKTKQYTLIVGGGEPLSKKARLDPPPIFIYFSCHGFEFKNEDADSFSIRNGNTQGSPFIGNLVSYTYVPWGCLAHVTMECKKNNDIIIKGLNEMIKNFSGDENDKEIHEKIVTTPMAGLFYAQDAAHIGCPSIAKTLQRVDSGPPKQIATTNCNGMPLNQSIHWFKSHTFDSINTYIKEIEKPIDPAKKCREMQMQYLNERRNYKIHFNFGDTTSDDTQVNAQQETFGFFKLNGTGSEELYEMKPEMEEIINQNGNYFTKEDIYTSLKKKYGDQRFVLFGKHCREITQ